VPVQVRLWAPSHWLFMI